MFAFGIKVLVSVVLAQKRGYREMSRKKMELVHNLVKKKQVGNGISKDACLLTLDII